MDLKIRKYFELKKNKTTFQNQWDAAEEVLRRIFIASNVDTGKEERSQINNLIFNARKKNQKKSKRNSSRRKVIKMRAEKSIKLKTKNQENKTNETESWSFEKISKIDLTRLKRRKREDVNYQYPE